MRYWLALLAGLIVLTGCGAPSTGPAPATSQAPSVVVDYVAPATLSVPALALADESIVPVGLTPEDVVDTDFPAGQVAWYEYSVRPGEIGPMVILGHVDGGGQPGVFARLDELGMGDEIVVNSVTYIVTGKEQVPKDAFPTDRVYGPTPGAEVRLITCGGPFGTEREGHYDDNVIVYGAAVETE